MTATAIATATSAATIAPEITTAWFTGRFFPTGGGTARRCALKRFAFPTASFLLPEARPTRVASANQRTDDPETGSEEEALEIRGRRTPGRGPAWPQRGDRSESHKRDCRPELEQRRRGRGGAEGPREP